MKIKNLHLMIFFLASSLSCVQAMRSSKTSFALDLDQETDIFKQVNFGREEFQLIGERMVGELHQYLVNTLLPVIFSPMHQDERPVVYDNTPGCLNFLYMVVRSQVSSMLQNKTWQDIYNGLLFRVHFCEREFHQNLDLYLINFLSKTRGLEQDLLLKLYIEVSGIFYKKFYANVSHLGYGNHFKNIYRLIAPEDIVVVSSDSSNTYLAERVPEDILPLIKAACNKAFLEFPESLQVRLDCVFNETAAQD